jgi:hypothetical protein
MTIGLVLGGCGAEAEEEACSDWFCEEGSSSTTSMPDDAGGDATTGKGGTTTGKGGTTGGKGTATTGLSLMLSYELDAETGLGMFWLESDGCMSSFTVDEAAARADCDGCDFAFDIISNTVGPDDAPCDGEEVWIGLTQSMGHADPGSLFYAKEGDWQDISATSTSEIVDGTWYVEITY